MYCNKCGKQIPDGSSFCTSCGNPIPASAPSASPVKPVDSSYKAWRCPKCDTSNSIASKVCKTCGTARRGDETLVRVPVGGQGGGFLSGNNSHLSQTRLIKLAISAICYIVVIILMFGKWVSIAGLREFSLFEFNDIASSLNEYAKSAESGIFHFVTIAMIVLCIISTVMFALSIIQGLMGRDYQGTAVAGKAFAIILAIVFIITIFVLNSNIKSASYGMSGDALSMTAIPWIVLFLPIVEDIVVKRINL